MSEQAKTKAEIEADNDRIARHVAPYRYGPGTSLSHEQGNCLPNCGYCHDAQAEIERQNGMYSEAEIRHVFVEVAQGRDNHGDFLKDFSRAVMRADSANFALLRPAATALIYKYSLEKYLDNYPAGV
jgi:hypothetical protein